MSANVDAMVREGINAYKVGRKDEARALLLKATELDQFNEQAWLWLSGLMDAPDDQRTCLENVLAINPNNERAKQGLSYLTGQTSAGNVSPFSAATPPPAPSPGAPTSVEWGGEPEPESASASWNTPRPVEPSGAALDDWVTNLNLPVNDTQNESSFFTAATSDDSASPFGDFELDEDDMFTSGPFSAAPLALDDEPAAPPLARSSRRSPTPPAAPRTSPEPPRRARNAQGRGNGALLSDADRDRDGVYLEQGEGEMFGFIPPEIAPTRLPGTNERVPVVLTLGMILLILLNLGMAVFVMMNILT